MSEPITRVGKIRAKPASVIAPKRQQWTIAVDFDGTLLNHDDVEEGRRMGRPFDGAVEVMHQLKEAGARIIVLTCRARPTEVLDGVHWENSVKHVIDWLRFYGIPFDDVTAMKPLADVYVDDRAVRFEGRWDALATDLLAQAYMAKWAK